MEHSARGRRTGQMRIQIPRVQAPLKNGAGKLADQLVLFVTDEELRDQARKNLEPRIGAEYRLEFDHQTSCTEIAEVIR